MNRSLALRAAGAAIGIAQMLLLATVSQTPLALVPFATSIVLVMGTPEAAPARPWAVLGGHLISTLSGLAAVKLFGPHLWVAAFAVGIAVAGMFATRSFHPPAGIDPVIVVMNDLSWGFLIAPVAIGAVMIASVSAVWLRVLARLNAQPPVG